MSKKSSCIAVLVALSRLPVGSSARRQLRREHESASQRHPLLLATGQLARAVRQTNRPARLRWTEPWPASISSASCLG